MEEAQNNHNHSSLSKLSSLKRSISLTGVKIPMRQCASYQMKLAPYLLNKPYSANIVQDNANTLDKRVILLKEGISNELEGLPEDIQSWIQTQKESGLEVVTHNLDIDYKSYSLDQLLKMLLPSGVETTLKVENIRDIKIYELTEEQMKHRDIFTKVIIEKSPANQCNLLKIRHSDDKNPLSKYFFEQRYELLSGEPNTEIEVSEGPCTYKMDLLKVFYDSAFQDERERLLTVKNKDDIICDVFGDPFYSIRAAKTNHIRVMSNCNHDTELNKFYEDSIRLNHVELLVKLQNQDLYSFLHDALTKAYTKEGGPRHANHIYISKFLEDCSFLKLFVGLFKQINNPYYENADQLPYLHFYIYVPNEDFTDSMRKILSNKLNNIFNEAFKNKEIKDIVDTDDFQTIFIVHDDVVKRKLLHCTIKLSNKVAYCPESLVEGITSVTVQTTTEKSAEEAAAPMQVEEAAPVQNEESAPAQAEEAKPAEADTEAKAEGATAMDTEEAKENTKTKSAKKTSTARKSRKEVVHKPSKDADELEKEAADEDQANGGLRRSSRKKTKSKQFDDYDYPPSANKEPSK